MHDDHCNDLVGQNGLDCGGELEVFETGHVYLLLASLSVGPIKGPASDYELKTLAIVTDYGRSVSASVGPWVLAE
jgi:hypothetical protein